MNAFFKCEHSSVLAFVADNCNTGVEAAVNWLVKSEGEPPDRRDVETGQELASVVAAQPSTSRAASVFSPKSAGVAGILRREQQVAASTDRSRLSCHHSSEWLTMPARCPGCATFFLSICLTQMSLVMMMLMDVQSTGAGVLGPERTYGQSGGDGGSGTALSTGSC